LEGSPTKTEETCEWGHIKLRKSSQQGLIRQESDTSAEIPSRKSPLRKARSYSTNDILDERPEFRDEASSELRKILNKKKAEAERGKEHYKCISFLNLCFLKGMMDSLCHTRATSVFCLLRSCLRSSAIIALQ